MFFFCFLNGNVRKIISDDGYDVVVILCVEWVLRIMVIKGVRI